MKFCIDYGRCMSGLLCVYSCMYKATFVGVHDVELNHAADMDLKQQRVLYPCLHV
jgi:hypothetical protein